MSAHASASSAHLATEPPPPVPQSHKWLPRLLLAVAVIGSVAGNLWWIAHNQMLMGRDASGYLLTALEYRDFLSPISWQGLFEAFVYPPYRTPALYLAAQPWLALPLSGGAMDSAQLLNVALSALTVVLTWHLARTFTGLWTALLAATLVAFLPNMAAMGRLFYTEALLVAMVALNLLALYRGRGFSQPGWSLVWGASAGVGMLAKWTFPIYIALPLLVVLWRERRALLHAPVWNARAALAGICAGAVFVALWWLPNRELATTLPAGNWAALGWFLIVADCVYALLMPDRHGRARKNSILSRSDRLCCNPEQFYTARCVGSAGGAKGISRSSMNSITRSSGPYT